METPAVQVPKMPELDLEFEAVQRENEMLADKLIRYKVFINNNNAKVKKTSKKA